MVSCSQRKITEEKLRKLYVVSMFTDKQVARELDCTKQAVYLARKKFGIPAIHNIDRNSRDVKITPTQQEIIRGTLLGDAYIDTSGALEITHGKRQKEYLTWLYRKLFPLLQQPKPDRTCFRARSKIHRDLLALRKEHYKKGRKIITTSLLEKLTPRSLAIWFCDDGQLYPSERQSRFSTCGFSKKENDLIADYLQSAWGVQGRVAKYYGYYYVFMNNEGTQKFIKLIKPFTPQCMKYKIGGL